MDRLTLPLYHAECADGSFGSECIKKCHCQPGISCLRANGACENNACHSEWAGSACQTREYDHIAMVMVMTIRCASFSLGVAYSNFFIGNPTFVCHAIGVVIKLGSRHRAVEFPVSVSNCAIYTLPFQLSYNYDDIVV